MTPYEIDILLQYHSLMNEWSGPRFGNELHLKTMDKFVAQVYW
jgi:hypothetical protein